MWDIDLKPHHSITAFILFHSLCLSQSHVFTSTKFIRKKLSQAEPPSLQVEPLSLHSPPLTGFWWFLRTFPGMNTEALRHHVSVIRQDKSAVARARRKSFIKRVQRHLHGMRATHEEEQVKGAPVASGTCWLSLMLS